MPGGQLGRRGSSVGRLRHQITIQSQNTTQTRDEFGQANQNPQNADAWITGATTWARVQAIVGTKFMDSQKEQANVTHMIITRHRTDIDESCQLIWLGNGNNVIFSVIAVQAYVGDENCLEIWAKQQKF
jgi:SPP1 family predicted phage head-tail adaptor